MSDEYTEHTGVCEFCEKTEEVSYECNPEYCSARNIDGECTLFETKRGKNQ